MLGLKTSRDRDRALTFAALVGLRVAMAALFLSLTCMNGGKVRGLNDYFFKVGIASRSYVGDL